MTMVRTQPRPLPPPWDRLFPLATRVFVWAVIGSVIYLLRSFFLLIFLTFVFAYVQAHGVHALGRVIRPRWIRVVMVALTFMGVIVGTGFWVVPNIERTARTVVANKELHFRDIGIKLGELRRDYPTLQSVLPEVDPKYPGEAAKGLLNKVLGFGKAQDGAQTQELATQKLKDIGTFLLAIISAFLLSLLFAFLIVLYLPQLTALVKALEHTKLRFIYIEAAQNIRDFGLVLGRSLEAQLLVAILNTILTAIGLWAMGLPEIAFLSTIVFFFSFVPVAGVFISSVPICLIALSTVGPSWMLLAILLITGIHMIETYILNPMIYGHHLHVNPVIVLAVLTVAGTLFHVWGLVLGVPVVIYIFGHAIHYKKGEEPTPQTGMLPFHSAPPAPPRPTGTP